MSGADWEIYRTDDGYCAELFEGANPRLLASVTARGKFALYVRMLLAQWRAAL